jgi:toxin ParE1/3/4
LPANSKRFGSTKNPVRNAWGADFIDEFERHVLTIAAMPTRWMVEQGDIRRSLMKRFPYVILFRLISDDWIRITVIKHEKRHPAFGRSRR